MITLIETIDSLYTHAEEYYNKKFKRPTIAFDIRGKSAGYARYDGHLRFNKVLYEQNRNEFLSQTVPHEIAHLISVELFGIALGKGHGRCWQSVMIDCFNLPANRCHDYDISNVGQTKKKLDRIYEYRCNCKVHNLTSIRYKRILSGIIYKCNLCNSRLNPI